MTNTVRPVQQWRSFLTLLFLSLTSLAINAATIYQGPADGSWNNADNWTNGLPAPGNDAEIFGGFSVVIDAPLTVDFKIDCFGSLTISSALTNEGTINLSGPFTVTSTGSVTNKSQFNTFGNSTFAAGSSFLNESSGSFTNGGPLALETTLVNQGFITNNAFIDASAGTVQSGGTFQNNQQLTTESLTVEAGSGFTNNFGATLLIFSTSGSFLLEGTVTNSGQIINEGNTQVIGILNNNVTFTNEGNFTLTAAGQVTNTGMFITSSVFINEGAFTNGFLFQNSGEVTNSAQFFNNNQIENLVNGIFTNEADALIQGGFGSLILNTGDFTSQGNISTPGTIRNHNAFQNEGLINLPSGSTLYNDADFFNFGAINSNNSMTNDGLLFNYGTININAGSVLVNNATLNNFNPGHIINSQEFENKPSGVFNNEGMVTNKVRMFLEGVTTNNGSFENQGDIFILAGGVLENMEVLLQSAGNISNEGDINNFNLIINDGCSSIRNLGTIDNQDVIENSGIFLQRGILTGNAIVNMGGYVHTSNSNVAPDICQDFTTSATVDGLVKVYTNSLIAFSNFDSCANIIYRGNGLGLNIYNCDDIGSVIPVEVSIKTRLNDELTCTAQVTPADSLAPVFTGCPTNMNILTDSNQVSVSWTPPTALDNCTAASLSSDRNPGDLFPVGSTAVTYTSVDGYGNSNQCQFQVIVVKTPPADSCDGDVTPPSIGGCPNSQTIASDFPTAVATWKEPEFTDACQPLMVMVSAQPGSSFPVGTTQVTYTAKDGKGNIATCQFQINVTLNDPCTTDTQPPSFISCPQNIFLNQNPIINGAVAIWTAPGATDNCQLQSIITTHIPGVIFPVGSTTVTYTATDASSNVVTCTFVVTVGADPCPGDFSPPVFTGCPNNINLSTPTASAIANWTPPTAFDACQPVSLFSNRQPGTIFTVGTTSVFYTASDAKGNTSTCSFSVTVTNPCLSDFTPPTISNCPDNISVNTIGNSAPAGWTPPTATDNCTLASLSAPYLPGAIFPLGETTVTYTATDANGNISTCTFTVSVTNPCLTDLIPPTINNCPENVTVNTAGNSAPASWTPPTATDNCTLASLSAPFLPGAIFPLGETTVTYTALDAKDNAAYCSFKVIVQDKTPPTALCKNALVFLNEDGKASITTSTVNEGSSDANGIATLSVNPSAFDCTQTGNRQVTLTVTDNFNNVASCVATVQVTDAIKPVITCPQGITVCQGEKVQFTGPVASDNCGFIILQTGGPALNPGGVYPVGPNTLQFTAIDGNANAASCSFTVNVLAVPSASISAAPCKGFCQGAAELTANHSGSATYLWSNGKSSKSVLVAPGNYTVTVTYANGCKSTATATVAPVAPTSTAAYTILAQDEVHVHQNTVYTGGVGVWKAGSTAKIHDKTNINSFLRSPKTDIDKDCNVNQVVLAAAPNPTTVFTLKTNPMPAAKDTVIKENVTAHIYGNNFEKVEIRKGATAIFYASTDIMVKEFKTADSDPNKPVKIIFQNPVDVVVKKKLEIGKYSIVNQNGPNVTFHLSDHALIREGNIFHANIYAPGHDLNVDDAKDNYHTEMVGLFIAKKVDAKKFVDWFQNAPVTPAPQLLAPSEQLVFNAYQEPENVRVRLDWVTNTEYKNESFVVEKSSDGIHFEPLLEVESTRDDDRPEIYKNQDDAPVEGANFYRLKLNYQDGSTAYSDTKKVWIHLDPEAFNLFPNPASEVISFYKKEWQGKNAVIKITSGSGIPLREVALEALPYEPVSFDIRDFKSGVYVISVKAKGHREVSRQFVVTKD